MRNALNLVQIRDGAILPARATPGSFGYDLAIPTSMETIDIPAGATVVVPLGWKLGEELPLAESAVMVAGERGLKSETIGGVGMLIFPRSSLALKHGLLVGNSPGLIDSDYTGEIGVVVTNFSGKLVTLYGGQRIAQFVLVFMDFFPIAVTTAQVQETERGGFGSTGA